MANENKAPVLLSRRVRLKANEAAIVGLRMKNYNELSDNKQVCKYPNSQSAAAIKDVLERNEDVFSKH